MQNPMSDYLRPVFTEKINSDSVNTIIELGCHNGWDTVILRDYFSAAVIAFECNPLILPETRRALSHRNHIQLIEKAVWDQEGDIEFYPVTRCEDNGHRKSNTGASSCFKARSDYRQKYQQDCVMVEATTVDQACVSEKIGPVDLICMDVQGAALHALRGSVATLESVRYIITEIEHRAIYHRQDLFPEIDQFLVENGFVQVAVEHRDAWFNDYLYQKM